MNNRGIGVCAAEMLVYGLNRLGLIWTQLHNFFFFNDAVPTIALCYIVIKI